MSTNQEPRKLKNGARGLETTDDDDMANLAIKSVAPLDKPAQRGD